MFRFKKSEAKRGRLVFDQAASLEASGNYEDACFHYAVAANAGYQAKLCRKKIKNLWNAHGPFLFSEQLQKLKAEYCPDASCGEGFHHITVSDIHKWVKEKE